MHEVMTAVLLIDVLELFFYSNFFDFPSEQGSGRKYL